MEKEVLMPRKEKMPTIVDSIKHLDEIIKYSEEMCSKAKAILYGQLNQEEEPSPPDPEDTSAHANLAMQFNKRLSILMARLSVTNRILNEIGEMIG